MPAGWRISTALVCLFVLGPQVQRAAAQQAATLPAAGIPALPPLTALPNGCGSVTQVLPGATCQSISDWAGLPLARFERLNPFLMCGILDLTPGAAVCTGDNDSFCAHLVIASQNDTCADIEQQAGTIVNIDGTRNTTCSDLAAAADMPVCVNPDVSKCQRDTICDVAISADLQSMLALQPDFCSILDECKASPELTTVGGKPSLVLTITSRTSQVVHAIENGSHPALNTLAVAWAAGQPAALRITLTPNWFADGGNSGQTRFEFGEVASSGTRKLNGYVWRPRYYGPTGFMRVPHLWYYSSRG